MKERRIVPESRLAPRTGPGCFSDFSGRRFEGRDSMSNRTANDRSTTGYRVTRTFTCALLIAGVCCVSQAPVAAQQPYPVKPLRIISPYPPGGGNDTLSRTIATKLSE